MSLFFLQNISMGKLIFFDIDGTLVIDGKIPPSAEKALRLLRENGHITAVASGRHLAMMKPVTDRLGIEYAVCDGGNTIVHDGKIIFTEPLSTSVTHPLYRELLEKKIPFAVMPDTRYNRLTADFRMMRGRRERSFEAIRCRMRIYWDLFHRDAYKVFMEIHPGEEDRIRTIDLHRITRWADDSLGYEPDDKYRGIEKLLQITGMEKNDLVFFGDGLNDLTMFEKIPFSVCMGNGVEELKEKAYYVTDRAERDGIYKACRHFGWIGEDQ